MFHIISDCCLPYILLPALYFVACLIFCCLPYILLPALEIFCCLCVGACECSYCCLQFGSYVDWKFFHQSDANVLSSPILHFPTAEVRCKRKLSLFLVFIVNNSQDNHSMDNILLSSLILNFSTPLPSCGWSMDCLESVDRMQCSMREWRASVEVKVMQQSGSTTWRTGLSWQRPRMEDV